MSDSIKIHVFRGDNNGTANCDFRGANAIGHNEGDEHRTVAEIKNADQGLIELVLADGGRANGIFAALRAAEPDFAANVATALGLGGDGKPGLRIGVWTPGVEG